ncbi:hypothetical protein ACWEFY_35135, partial [Nocardia sp. NPDC004750]
MIEMTLREIAEVVGGTLHDVADPEVRVTGAVEFDSRRIGSGERGQHGGAGSVRIVAERNRTRRHVAAARRDHDGGHAHRPRRQHRHRARGDG